MSVRAYAAEVCARLRQVLLAVDEAELSRLVEEIDKSARVFVLGKGRSGTVMRMLAMRLMHLGMAAYVVDETTTPSIGPDDLLLIGSGSGQTRTCRVLAEVAGQAGARLGLLTAEAGATPIASLAGFKVVIPVWSPVTEAGQLQQFGGSLFEQALLICLDAVVEAVRRKRGVPFSFMKTKHANLE